MSERDFYKILGVGRAASADEIKSAFRELVKKHHPDLYRTPEEKSAASNRLRLINEAYAILGNRERRRKYDEATQVETKHSAEQPKRPAEQAKRPAAAKVRRRRPMPERRRAAPRRIVIPQMRWQFPRNWPAYALAVAIAAVALASAGQGEPKLATVWVLAQKLEVSSQAGNSGGDGWSRVGEYDSASECAASIKKQVRDDEREGSVTVHDETNGSMAITVLAKKGGFKGQDALAGDAATSSEAKDAIKRVRTLQCRSAQKLETESWLGQAFRKVEGLF